jgi:C-terminal processing protease CtpA/Prc
MNRGSINRLARVLGIPVAALLLARSAAHAQSLDSARVAPSPAAVAYLDTVLAFMQENWVAADRADWASLRGQALAGLRGDASASDVYAAIRGVLASQGDHHSRLFSPEEARDLARGRVGGFGLKALYPEGTVIEVYAGSPADRAGIRVGDTVSRVHGSPIRADARGVLVELSGDTASIQVIPAGSRRHATVLLAREPVALVREPWSRRLGGIGYLELPEHIGVGDLPSGDTYQNVSQRAIELADHPPACGWIVDLRRNGGGNMWPMLAGVGPLLGNGYVGAFVGRGGTTAWRYESGGASAGRTVIVRVTRTYVPTRIVPVAVLISRATASSGEAIVIAFRGRSGVRMFGEPTEGVPTANVLKPLPDGALLVLTTALDADRSGRTYEGRIPPDETVATSWAHFGTHADPVMVAAERWLLDRPECLRH